MSMEQPVPKKNKNNLRVLARKNTDQIINWLLDNRERMLSLTVVVELPEEHVVVETSVSSLPKQLGVLDLVREELLDDYWRY